MKHKINNKNIKMKQDIHQKPDFLGIIFQFAALFAGVYAVIFVFSDGMELKYNKGMLIAAVIFTILIYFAIFMLPEYSKFSIPVLIIITAILIWKNRLIIIDGIFHIENSVIYLINQYFDMKILKYVTEYEEIKAVTYLMILIAQIAALLISIVIFMDKMKWILYLIVTITISSIFAVGNVPPNIPLLLLVLLIILNITSGFVPVQESALQENKKLYNDQTVSKHNDRLKENMVLRRKRIRFGMYPVAFALILLSILMFIYPSRKYEEDKELREQTVNNIRRGIENINLPERFEQMSDKFKDMFFSDKEGLINISKSNYDVYYGGLSGGKLGKVGEVAFTNQTALKLTIPSDTESLYLKGFVGMEYDGDSWKPMSKEEDIQYQQILEQYGNGKFNGITQIEDFLKLFLNESIILNNDGMSSSLDMLRQKPLKKSVMTMDYHIADNKYLYLPYVTSGVRSEDIIPVSDSYYLPKNEKGTYYVDYYELSSEQIVSIMEVLMSELELYQYDDINNNEAYHEYLEFANIYKEFVYETYTKIPEGLERITNLADRIMYSNRYISDINGYEDNSKAWLYNTDVTIKNIENVNEYLRRNTQYTLSPGTLPDGVDYAEYFLFDNQKGYCAHYATSAVLLLRSMGVPARYVEGYIVTKDDIRNGIVGGESEKSEFYWYTDDNIKELTNNSMQEMITVEIRDTNAHAWIEVYMDGFGWVPMEVTSGYSYSGVNDSYNPTIRNRLKDSLEPTRLPTNTPTPAEDPKDIPESNDYKEEDKFNEPNKQDSDNEGLIEEKGENANDIRGIWKLVNWLKNTNPLFRCFFIFGFAYVSISLVVFIRYFIFSFIIKERITKGQQKRRVLWLYNEMERLFKRLYIKKDDTVSYLVFAKEAVKYGQAPKDFIDIMEIILRARFSDEEVTEQEYTEVYNCYMFFRRAVYSRIGYKKYKWIKYFVVL